MRPSGRHLYAAARSLPHAEIARQVRIGREHGVNGFCFYSYRRLLRNNGFAYLGSGPFRQPAAVPRMEWLR